MTQQNRPYPYSLAWTASFGGGGGGVKKEAGMQDYHVPLTPHRRAVHDGKKLLERDLNFYTCRIMLCFHCYAVY